MLLKIGPGLERLLCSGDLVGCSLSLRLCLNLTENVIDTLWAVRDEGGLKALQAQGTLKGWQDDALKLDTRFGHLHKVVREKVTFLTVSSDHFDQLALACLQQGLELIVRESNVAFPDVEIEINKEDSYGL